MHVTRESKMYYWIMAENVMANENWNVCSQNQFLYPFKNSQVVDANNDIIDYFPQNGGITTNTITADLLLNEPFFAATYQNQWKKNHLMIKLIHINVGCFLDCKRGSWKCKSVIYCELLVKTPYCLSLTEPLSVWKSNLISDQEHTNQKHLMTTDHDIGSNCSWMTADHDIESIRLYLNDSWPWYQTHLPVPEWQQIMIWKEFTWMTTNHDINKIHPYLKNNRLWHWNEWKKRHELGAMEER